jgi:hypothetical protein
MTRQAESACARPAHSVQGSLTTPHDERAEPMKSLATTLTRVMLLLGAGLIAIQLVPYGRPHTNPPVVQEPKWDRASTRMLASRACFDCHSNETQWPWYSNVAPISWMVTRHIAEGREALNFSEWQRTYEEADEAAESVTEGEMPLTSYLLAHPSARLTPEEKRELARGLTATLGSKSRDRD